MHTLFRNLVERVAWAYRRNKSDGFPDTVRRVIAQSGFRENEQLISEVCSVLGRRGAQKRNRMRKMEMPQSPAQKSPYVSVFQRADENWRRLLPSEQFRSHIGALSR